MTWTLWLACASTQPQDSRRPPASSGAGASHLEVELGPQEGKRRASGPRTERERILLVMRESDPAARSCYAQELQTQEFLYGDMLLEVGLGSDGGVEEIRTVYSSLASQGLERCVRSVIEGLDFPKPEGGSLRFSYPYVFTSDRTPPEVKQALLVRHGLAERLPEGLLNMDEDDPSLSPARGEQGWWESW